MALFVHWDAVIKLEQIRDTGKTVHGTVSNLKDFYKVLSSHGDSEHMITKKLYERLKKLYPKRERRIGGNAGNAAVALAELDIPCVISCPLRPKGLMQTLARFGIRVVNRGKDVMPVKVAKDDPEIEHLVFECGQNRKIFVWDPFAQRLMLDQDFWESVRNTN
ncbi:MAG: hypothetical protein DRP15_02360, partial [Candidatus Aenigmatarchaeota archaeon]